METKFTVGSIVTAFGLEGVVESIDTSVTERPVAVKWNNIHYWKEFFMLDGRALDHHKEPSLKLVKRAEEFEEVVGYVCIYKYFHSVYPQETDTIFETKEDASKEEHSIGYREVKYMRRKA